jgi:hypothetical protein
LDPNILIPLPHRINDLTETEDASEKLSSNDIIEPHRALERTLIAEPKAKLLSIEHFCPTSTLCLTETLLPIQPHPKSDNRPPKSALPLTEYEDPARKAVRRDKQDPSVPAAKRDRQLPELTLARIEHDDAIARNPRVDTA